MSKKTGMKFKDLFKSLGHSFRRIGNHIKYSTKLFYRSRLTIFLFIIYPIILLLLFGSIFAKEDLMLYELEIQDKDSSPLSIELIQDLDDSGFLTLGFEIGLNENPKEFLQSNSKYACLIIPENWYEESLIHSISNVTLIINPYTSGAQRVAHIVTKTINEFNMKKNGSTPVVDLETEDFSSENISYIDFFLPGIIGVIIMNTGIIGTIMRQVHLQKIGVLRKFTTIPLTRIEYVSAELIWQFMIAFIATLLSVLTAWGVFGYSWFSFNIMILPIVIVGVVLFSGLGLLLSQIVRSRNNALIVGAMITIPMFFLSGIFFDISNSKVLIILSKFSPLTFIVDALRASMITGNYSEAGINIAIALGIGIVAIVIGTIFTRWERD